MPCGVSASPGAPQAGISNCFNHHHSLFTIHHRGSDVSQSVGLLRAGVCLCKGGRCKEGDSPGKHQEVICSQMWPVQVTRLPNMIDSFLDGSESAASGCGFLGDSALIHSLCPKKMNRTAPGQGLGSARAPGDTYEDPRDECPGG